MVIEVPEARSVNVLPSFEGEKNILSFRSGQFVTIFVLQTVFWEYLCGFWHQQRVAFLFMWTSARHCNLGLDANFVVLSTLSGVDVCVLMLLHANVRAW